MTKHACREYTDPLSSVEMSEANMLFLTIQTSVSLSSDTSPCLTSDRSPPSAAVLMGDDPVLLLTTMAKIYSAHDPVPISYHEIRCHFCIPDD